MDRISRTELKGQYGRINVMVPCLGPEEDFGYNAQRYLHTRNVWVKRHIERRFDLVVV